MRAASASCWVYPRVCGGTIRLSAAVQQRRGLSPRMRGNPWLGNNRKPRVRSIPAYAGEPAGSFRTAGSARVYPRVCGGTDSDFGRTRPAAGLSPRMRGNPSWLLRVLSDRRSIPAYAGEPSGCGMRASRWTVYPRVCGGTPAAQYSGNTAPRLSPRMRGNHVAATTSPTKSGSIPAYAGEPGGGVVSGPLSGVYPRVCGGTSQTEPPPPTAGGLSPRMRGNQFSVPANGADEGSIPAYAGEPASSCPRWFPHIVYSRVCGGTRHSIWALLRVWRLSPRMRGNPTYTIPADGADRSIPAYAGEPAPVPTESGGFPVYPRVCGGTTTD